MLSSAMEDPDNEELVRNDVNGRYCHPLVVEFTTPQDQKEERSQESGYDAVRDSDS
jgi:hypothetical protein